ncbi:ATP synthase gamma chain 1 [Hibiscus syriacus]|uniref:ATP synthase gamma chain 1 n=1 Tax=Hibiscus syriacus TaxID=106335 RepID=A0A6A3CA89_HIBSY|nr:ATP synthase gamma chain 1 [Hibiscus syriacus]
MGGIQRRARSTSIPVEWICWLNGQGKVAPTPEEMMELEAREGNKKAVSSGKVGGPDLKSFIRQFQSASKGEKVERESDERPKETHEEKEEPFPESSEPTGSGTSYKPGTWQPPS